MPKDEDEWQTTFFDIHSMLRLSSGTEPIRLSDMKAAYDLHPICQFDMFFECIMAIDGNLRYEPVTRKV